MAELDSWNGAPDVWSSVRVAGQGQGGVLDRVRKGRTPTSAPLGWVGRWGEDVRVKVEEEEETGGMLTVWSEGAGMHQGMFVEVRLG